MMKKITRKKIICCLVSIIFIFSYFIYNPQLSFDDEVVEEEVVEEEVFEDLECRKRISDTKKFLKEEKIKFNCNALDSDNCGKNYKRLEKKRFILFD